VCFLERDFPVVLHGPVIPREVLSSGTCLVLSGEIHGKQRFRDHLIDGDNILLVPDPKDHETLTKQLRVVVEQPAAAVEIGARGALVASEFAQFSEFVDVWENALAGVVDPGAQPTVAVEPAAERIESALPWAKPMLGDSFDGLLTRFLGGAVTPEDEVPTPVLADLFCEFIADQVTGALSDIVRYQRARFWAMRLEDADPPVVNALSGTAPTGEAMRALYPFRTVAMQVHHFDYDVTSLFCLTDEPEVTSADSLPCRSGQMCFARLPNLSPTELRLNDATVLLLEACDGGQAADGLADVLSGRGDAAVNAGEQEVFAVLGRLYATGVLAFAESPATAAPLMRGR
jgi:hypothetical protein